MKEIVNKLTLDEIGQQPTAFLIGVNYHFGCHIDANIFYTLATVIAPKDICVGDVIYYFLFPNFGIKIPLRYGDLFLFNPVVPHSCSNPRFPGCHIMPAYKSCKAILRSHPL